MADPGSAIPKMLVKVDGERLRTLPLAPVDGFVLSRIDGVLSVEELAAITGLALTQVLASISKLQQLKLVEMPKAAARPRTTPPPRANVPQPSPSSPRPIANRTAQRPGAPPSDRPPLRVAPPRQAGAASPPPQQPPSPPPPPVPPPAPSSPREIADAAPLEPEAGVELEAEHQRSIHALFTKIRELDHYAVLGIPRNAEKKAVKRAYFELASKFHPDKFFRKNLGSFKLKMETIFGKVTEAYETLSSKEQRAEYDAYLASLEKTRGIEALLEDAMTELKRAEEAARLSIPTSTAPPPTSGSIAPSATTAPGMPPRPPAPSQPEPVRAPTITPAAARAPQAPAQPAPTNGSPRPAPSTHTSSPNLGAFIADALGGVGTTPSTAPQPRPSGAPSAPRISLPPGATEAPGAQARRETLARRLMGGMGMRVPAAPKVPTVQYATPADAVDALKRRYEDKVSAARAAQAKKYAAIGAAERAKNDLVAAANAYRVAVSFAQDDEELKRAAEETQRAADELLSEGYLKQAQYEERSEHWAEAAKSWARVARARPNDAKAHERAAHCLVKADGNLHEAGNLAQRAVVLDPKHVSPRVTLANVYLAAGLTLNARRELEAAAQMAPQDAAIQALLKRVAKGGA